MLMQNCNKYLIVKKKQNGLKCSDKNEIYSRFDSFLTDLQKFITKILFQLIIHTDYNPSYCKLMLFRAVI